MPPTTLNRNIDKIGFVNREKNSVGEVVKYRCGRDFLYYALHYYYPEEFNASQNNALQIEKSHMFGLSLPWWLMWTQLQFIYLPELLSKLNLQLQINGKQINTFIDMFTATAKPKKSNADQKIRQIEAAVDEGDASGIDISLGLRGLVDHILFVHGYDEHNLYVLDTHKVPKLEYEKITEDNRYYMKLPKSVIRNRWTRFGRVWIVKKKI